MKQIGIEIGHAGMKDRNEIIPLLHSLRRPTFLSRDDDFYHPLSYQQAFLRLSDVLSVWYKM